MHWCTEEFLCTIACRKNTNWVALLCLKGNSELLNGTMCRNMFNISMNYNDHDVLVQGLGGKMKAILFTQQLIGILTKQWKNKLALALNEDRIIKSFKEDKRVCCTRCMKHVSHVYYILFRQRVQGVNWGVYKLSLVWLSKKIVELKGLN